MISVASLNMYTSAHSPQPCVAGSDKLQCQLSELLEGDRGGGASDDVVHALGNTPTSSLLAWALAPCLCQAVLSGHEVSSPPLAYSLHAASNAYRYWERGIQEVSWG